EVPAARQANTVIDAREYGRLPDPDGVPHAGPRPAEVGVGVELVQVEERRSGAMQGCRGRLWLEKGSYSALVGYGGAIAGGSQGPVVNSWRSASSLGMSHLAAVDR